MAIAKVRLSSVTPYSQSKHYEEPKKDGETSADYEKRTWRQRCHADDKGMLFIPPMVFKNALSITAKRLGMQVKGRGKSTYTKHFEAGLLVLDPVPLDIHKDDVIGESLFVPSSGIRGDGKRVTKIFPLIPQWQGEVTFHVIDPAITKDVFTKHLSECGKFTGVGRFRPEKNGYYGRFKVDSIDWTDGQ